MDDFDEYGCYENDLQDFSDREAWEDAVSDINEWTALEERERDEMMGDDLCESTLIEDEDVF